MVRSRVNGGRTKRTFMYAGQGVCIRLLRRPKRTMFHVPDPVKPCMNKWRRRVAAGGNSRQVVARWEQTCKHPGLRDRAAAVTCRRCPRRASVIVQSTDDLEVRRGEETQRLVAAMGKKQAGLLDSRRREVETSSRGLRRSAERHEGGRGNGWAHLMTGSRRGDWGHKAAAVAW